jgi:hypothetical protein
MSDAPVVDPLTASTFQVPAGAKRRAQTRAKRDGTTLSDVVRLAITAYADGKTSVRFPGGTS